MSGRVIALAAGKGGQGKTLATVSLGAALAARGLSVLVVDVNAGLRGLDIALGLESRVAFDLGDVLEGLCEAASAIVPAREAGVGLLAAPPLGGKDTLAEAPLLALLASLRAGYDFILLDTPPACGAAFETAARAADTALLLASPDDAALRAAERVSGLLRRAEVFDQRLVVSRILPEHVDAGLQYTPEVCAQVLDMPLLAVLPEDPEALQKTLEKESLPKDSPAGRGFLNLAERLLCPEAPLCPWREARPVPEPRRGLFARLGRQAPGKEAL